MSEQSAAQMDAQKDLANKPIIPLVFSLAGPAIVAQAVNALYTIVDRLFIAHIPEVGDMAIAGIGICFPVTIAVSAFALLIGSGGAPLASIALGKGDVRGAERILSTSTATLIAISLTLTVLLELTKEPVLRAFGASDHTLPYASDFLSVYLLGTLFVQITLGLNTFISAQGKAIVAMVSVLIGAGISVILDPIFIFWLDMGVRGAAMANVISQFLSAAWIVAFLASPRSAIRYRSARMTINRTVLPVLALGASPFVMQLTECAINVVFNSQLSRLGGDDYVAAMTIITSTMQLIYVVNNGLQQGLQPVISYNYGARNYARVRYAYRLGIGLLLVVMSAMVTVIAMVPESFARLFTADDGIIAIVGSMMPLFVCGWGIFGIQCGVQCTLVGLGLAKPSLFLAILRKIILLIPLAFILPHFMGVVGVFAAEPISDITSAVVSVFVFRHAVARVVPRTGALTEAASQAA
ncbi:MATE family efflux transporter [Bifidobacterium felsineum]|uniref:MATE family efflux transporter n=1 Tax=Bifidobacterium felsineum TaxID=2045440 RepID=UPI001F0AE574|nr:MATE family efflux transporter [Bifidobacterium felsineum]